MKIEFNIHSSETAKAVSISIHKFCFADHDEMKSMFSNFVAEMLDESTLTHVEKIDILEDVTCYVAQQQLDRIKIKDELKNKG